MKKGSHITEGYGEFGVIMGCSELFWFLFEGEGRKISTGIEMLITRSEL